MKATITWPASQRNRRYRLPAFPPPLLIIRSRLLGLAARFVLWRKLLGEHAGLDVLVLRSTADPTDPNALLRGHTARWAHALAHHGIFRGGSGVESSPPRMFDVSPGVKV